MLALGEVGATLLWRFGMPIIGWRSSAPRSRGGPVETRIPRIPPTHLTRGIAIRINLMYAVRINLTYLHAQYDSAEWEPAFLRQAREFLFFPLLPREASKRVPIFDRGTGSKPERLRSGSLQADLSLIV